ncbi:MAG: hypothetical protein AAFY20_14820 [Cyanobacteria bacterium J06639_14]
MLRFLLMLLMVAMAKEGVNFKHFHPHLEPEFYRPASRQEAEEMRIFPANNAKWLVHYWAGRYPGRLGHLWSPGRSITVYPHLNYAHDNGKFAAVMSARPWDEAAFRQHVATAASLSLAKLPDWVVVPDQPFNPRATLELWQRWEPELIGLGIPLAFAVQNGHTPADIPESASVVFLGGTDAWKFAMLPEFTATGKPVHVGRVNGRRLWQCERAGAASCDGTGWFRGDKRQLAILEHYLRCTAGEAEPPKGGQLSLLEENAIADSFLQRLEAKSFPVINLGSALPKNIDRSHLLKAISYWWDYDPKHRPRKWAVEYEGLHYPPKLLVSRANIWANGAPWPTRLFSGGQSCCKFLRDRGFAIVPIG